MKNEKLKFYIGDVRDYASIEAAMHGVDYVFNIATLKQVSPCEFPEVIDVPRKIGPL